MDGGRGDKFLVSFRIEWHSGGTRHCGGRWSLTVFKLLCKKQNKTTNKQKKQLALYTVEGRPSPRLRVFPWSWEGGHREGHVSCSL